MRRAFELTSGLADRALRSRHLEHTREYTDPERARVLGDGGILHYDNSVVIPDINGDRAEIGRIGIIIRRAFQY